MWKSALPGFLPILFSLDHLSGLHPPHISCGLRSEPIPPRLSRAVPNDLVVLSCLPTGPQVSLESPGAMDTSVPSCREGLSVSNLSVKQGCHTGNRSEGARTC